MMLSDIMKHALMQLGEDPADISEFDELFRVYANTGYQIAVDQFLKPREARLMQTNAQGIARIEGEEIARVVEAWTMPENRSDAERPREVRFALMPDGKAIATNAPDAAIIAVCEIRVPEMEEATDEPRLPLFAHAALADYICYRQLANGNMAKQNRAQAYRSSFYETMSRLRREGYGSVTKMKNLYRATEM